MASSNRTDVIIDVLRDAFAPLMRADPAAFRAKYRKMARDPHAYYRGSACLFFNDVTQESDDWAAHGSERIWIHGDLHVENFGTYLNSDGLLVFDVNDFDEAYLGHFTWDLQRFAASLALVGWQKALPEDDVRRLIGRYLRAYLSQVERGLHEHDERTGGQLVETVAAWLRADGDGRAAAEDLGIHRNTLRYRLARVEEVSGLDLTDPSARLLARLLLVPG